MKKNETLAFATTWVDFQGIMLSEINQTEKNKCHIISLTCGVVKIKTKNNSPQRS